jgi:signal transduction histidine kinase
MRSSVSRESSRRTAPAINGSRTSSCCGAKGLRLIAIVPDSTPINLDGERFAELVRHLLENALKFTPSGAIRVVMAMDIDSGRPRRLTVADSNQFKDQLG